jgi:hypothetical protein
VPFLGVASNEARPAYRDEKLERILKDLDKHHDAVRRNMMYLVSVQKDKLLSDAQEALKKKEELKQSTSMDIAESDDGLIDEEDMRI